MMWYTPGYENTCSTMSRCVENRKGVTLSVYRLRVVVNTSPDKDNTIGINDCNVAVVKKGFPPALDNPSFPGKNNFDRESVKVQVVVVFEMSRQPTKEQRNFLDGLGKEVISEYTLYDDRDCHVE